MREYSGFKCFCMCEYVATYKIPCKQVMGIAKGACESESKCKIRKYVACAGVDHIILLLITSKTEHCLRAWSLCIKVLLAMIALS